MKACGYTYGDWVCREGGYLWYAGDGEGWDPQDVTNICPHCRTADYLEAAKEDAESCSSWMDNGTSGTGVDLWVFAERRALIANETAARAALAKIGPVNALEDDDSPEGYSVVICNSQQVTP
ncbi:MAG: hypothetical protein M3Q94_10985 [Pseudomonadota bacterium]|nr:hypothetical protein [Pseudomonadota bacterium]